MSTVDDTAASLVGLLTDEGRKPPRVLARKIAEHLQALDLLADPVPDAPAGGELVRIRRRGEPGPWLRFADTLPDDVPVAVTRNRTDAALTHLGLVPVEVRAVVIEQDWLRVFRWTDRTTAQTMPILEEKTA